MDWTPFPTSVFLEHIFCVICFYLNNYTKINLKYYFFRYMLMLLPKGLMEIGKIIYTYSTLLKHIQQQRTL